MTSVAKIKHSDVIYNNYSYYPYLWKWCL